MTKNNAADVRDHWLSQIRATTRRQAGNSCAPCCALKSYIVIKGCSNINIKPTIKIMILIVMIITIATVIILRMTMIMMILMLAMMWRYNDHDKIINVV